ncbi:hypothetical protein KSS87_021885 [Heliosperma pusillum]|nr:hypothetical protein KSS87_021885 [Heliosperma pusillum]
MASRRNVKYSRLDDIEDDESYTFPDADNKRGKRYDPRFEYMPKSLDKVPWRSVLLALFLLSLGCILLVVSVFILTDHMGGERSQAYGLFALGIIAFLPGFYETRIAYYSWRGAAGYRFASIPDY